MSQLSPACRYAAFCAVAIGMTVAFLAQPVSSQAQQLTVAVAARGSVPGVKDTDLNRFLADTMNAGVQGPWRFEPAPAGATKAPNRIEWSIRSVTSAEGTVRSFGFARAAIDRMMGKHQILSIDATLFLGGQYQNDAHSEVPATKEAQNPELQADIVHSTQQLLAHEAPGATTPVPK